MADMAEHFTPAELLAQVDKAITAVLLGGQSYRIGNRSLTRADLAMLQNLRKELQAQVDADTGAGGHLFNHTYVAIFEGR